MNIYREAAKLANKARNSHDDGFYSCSAISHVSNGKRWPCNDSRLYSNLFSPYENPATYDAWGAWWSESLVEVMNCRVLALLFAAAMRDTGDL